MFKRGHLFLQAKHCQQCGKLIPVNAVFCQFCGAKQYSVNSTDNIQHSSSRMSRDVRPTQKSVPPMQPRPNIHMDKALLTHTDWAMLVINGLSALMQFLYSAQTMMMPLSKSDLEFDACAVIALAGLVVSGLDAYECYKNRLPMWSALLGVAGNILGIGLAALLYTDVMTIVGTIVLGISFWLIYSQIHHLYRK